jgi:hypothetical protein
LHQTFFLDRHDGHGIVVNQRIQKHGAIFQLSLGLLSLGDFFLQLQRALVHSSLEFIFCELQLGVALLDAVQHFVEAHKQVADLVIGLLRDAQGIVTASVHIGGCVGEFENRLGNTALQPQRKQIGRHERA